MSAAGDGGFDFGRVVTRSFVLIRRNPMIFLTLSFLAVAPEFAARYFMAQIPYFAGLSVFTLAYWLVALVTDAGMIFLSCLLQASFTYACIMDLNGRPVSLGESLIVALRAALPLFIIGVLYWAGFAFGLILLVFPAFMLMTAWSVSVPVRIVENTSIAESFSRSARLTYGHRWLIFGLLVVVWLGTIALDYAARPLFGVAMLGGGTTLSYYIAVGALRVLEYMVTATGTASVYYELRAAKDGVGSEHLASVFE